MRHHNAIPFNGGGGTGTDNLQPHYPDCETFGSRSPHALLPSRQYTLTSKITSANTFILTRTEESWTLRREQMGGGGVERES